jgi:hypothetical protein
MVNNKEAEAVLDLEESISTTKKPQTQSSTSKTRNITPPNATQALHDFFLPSARSPISPTFLH